MQISAQLFFYIFHESQQQQQQYMLKNFTELWMTNALTNKASSIYIYRYNWKFQ